MNRDYKWRSKQRTELDMQNEYETICGQKDFWNEDGELIPMLDLI